MIFSEISKNYVILPDDSFPVKTGGCRTPKWSISKNSFWYQNPKIVTLEVIRGQPRSEIPKKVKFRGQWLIDRQSMSSVGENSARGKILRSLMVPWGLKGITNIKIQLNFFHHCRQTDGPDVAFGLHCQNLPKFCALLSLQALFCLQPIQTLSILPPLFLTSIMQEPALSWQSISSPIL